MQEQELESLLRGSFPTATIQISGEPYHYQITLISASFVGLSQVQRQQQVYKALGTAFATGDLHALTLKTLTPEEDQQTRG